MKKWIVATFVMLHAAAVTLPHEVIATTIVELAKDVAKHYHVISHE